MRAFYIGPAPFWYLWFSCPDTHYAQACSFVDSVALWFALRNDQNRDLTPWRVRACSVLAAGAILDNPPCLREWSFPLPPATDLLARENITIFGRQAIIGSAVPLEPHVHWGPLSLAYVVRDEFPIIPLGHPLGPWKFWFSAPLRGQAFWRAEIIRTTDYGHGTAGSACVEVILLDGIVPPGFSSDFVRKNLSYAFA